MSTGHVYFALGEIGDVPAIKIGYSRNVPQRLRVLGRIELLGYLPLTLETGALE